MHGNKSYIWARELFLDDQRRPGTATKNEAVTCISVEHVDVNSVSKNVSLGTNECNSDKIQQV
jgi:hypothetical protein